MPLLMGVTVAAVMAVVVIRRHSLRPLLDLRLRKMWLIWAAAILQFARSRELGPVGWILGWHNGVLAVLAIWLLGATFVAVNLRMLPSGTRVGGVVLAAGFTLNSLAIVINGAMPFSTISARQAGVPAAAIGTPGYGHSPITADTALATITDVIPLPGLGVVVSIGDLMMLVGLTLVLSQAGTASTATPESTHHGFNRKAMK